MVNRRDPGQAAEANINLNLLKGLESRFCMTCYFSGGKYNCCKDLPGVEIKVHL